MQQFDSKQFSASTRIACAPLDCDSVSDQEMSWRAGELASRRSQVSHVTCHICSADPLNSSGLPYLWSGLCSIPGLSLLSLKHCCTARYSLPQGPLTWCAFQASVNSFDIARRGSVLRCLRVARIRLLSVCEAGCELKGSAHRMATEAEVKWRSDSLAIHCLSLCC